MKKTNPSSGALVEPLTRRERAILAYLEGDKSYREIAEQETLALSSVKWYIQQVYTKLWVNRRSKAIQRARELGLLKFDLVIPSETESSPRLKHNLPAQLTSFIGRQKEIGELRLLLRKKETRLLTLTGSGGTGKTRLALRAADELLDDFPNGVWLVDLAPLADPALVPQTVIAALGQLEQPGKSPMKQLSDYLREKKLLLVLDNCEHLVEACAELVAELLHSAPRLTILASSREILGVAGEVSYRVPPLEMPDPRKSPSLEELAQFEALQLFVERARLVDPAFTLTGENAPFVAQITQRLDGIPLAIELAAARLRLLTAGQIVERLNDAFRLLTGGSRTALPRHQTLQALIDWSYNLLTQAERGLLRGLSAFAGRWTLEAAEEVCGEGEEVLDLLRGLADKSLILAEPALGGKMRYRMLETVRQYAHARLVEAGEAEAVRARHLAYYLRLAERLEPKFRSREQIETLDDCGSELDNLRLALEWALQADVEAELRLAVALKWYWHIRMRYYLSEGISWLEQGLAAEALSRGELPLAGSRAAIRAKASAALGFHLTYRDYPDVTKAVSNLSAALLFYRESYPQHSQDLAWTLWCLGWCTTYGEKNLLKARALTEEALRLLRESGDAHGMADCLLVLANLEIDPGKQRKMYQEELATEQANGDIEGMANAQSHLAGAEFSDGYFEAACAAIEACLENYRRAVNPWLVAENKHFLGYAKLLAGDLDRAGQYLEAALADFREMANEGWVAATLFWKSLLAIAQGSYDQVVDLYQQIADLFGEAGPSAHMGYFSVLANVLYLRARLARLHGDAAAARRFAEEGLNAARAWGDPFMLALLEMGHLALQEGDLEQARAHFREGVQVFLVRSGYVPWVGGSLDGLAVLAVREGRLERAARLFGTRQCRGFAHTLSPIERAEREIDFAEITAALGQERFDQLREEGSTMSFEQLLALAQEEG